MASKIADILETMEYGPAPESAAPAMAWLDGHARRFGMFIDGEWTTPGDDRLFDSVKR
jgi:aldehyde dehydrogenase (NAD+)